MSQRDMSPRQRQCYEIIFGTHTGPGQWFDIALIIVILSSVTIVMLDSVPELNSQYGPAFLGIEWVFTLLFTLEYAVRIWCSPNRRAYITSGFGLVDLLSILPTYIALFLPAAAPLLMFRLLRILRIFRVLRLIAYIDEANILTRAISNSGRKILVFFCMMIVITTVFGCLIYVVEGPNNGFENIPLSIYWAIVTVTTVGYGDVVPMTAIGRTISALGMLTGYAIIAVPTGILTAELSKEIYRDRVRRNCPQCNRTGHDQEAQYCKHCGAELPEPLQ